MTAVMTKNAIATEYEKTKANLALLESLLQQAKRKEEKEQVISESKAEVKEDSQTFNNAKTELHDLQVILGKTIEEHTSKVVEWKQKSIDLEGILFKAEACSNASSDNDDDLERAADLAQLNAALLKQKLAIRQQSSAAKLKRTKVESLQIAISAKDEMQRALHIEITEIEEQIATDFSNYQQNLEGQVKAITGNTGTKISDPITGTEKESTVPSQTEQAYNEGCLSMRRLLKPLADAGLSVRSRKLEWEKNGAKNEGLVHRGNKASHYGMVLADASLYQDFCPEQRKDPKLYIQIYGLHPDFVWNNQDCKALLNILDWRGGMEDYSRSDPDTTTRSSISYPKTSSSSSLPTPALAKLQLSINTSKRISKAR